VRIDYVDNLLAEAVPAVPSPWKLPTDADSLSAQLSSMGTMAAAFGASPLIVNPLSPVLSSLGMMISAVWAPPTGFGAAAYKVFTTDAGIYRIYRDDLALDADLRDIRLYHLGNEVAIHIYDQNADNYLDAATDYIEFYAEPVDETYAKYTYDNIYWLVTFGGTGAPKRMISVNAAPESADLATEHLYVTHQEQDARYMGLAPGDDRLDRWYYYQYVLGTGFTGGPGPVPAHFALPVFGQPECGNADDFAVGLFRYGP